jgi:acyl-CoA thioester hydrolase
MQPTRRFRHTLRVRYGEVDRQGVVFNAHYLAYMDDALENWIATFGDLRQPHGWDMMLKKVTVEWQGSVGSGDLLDIDLGIVRWGRTSWTVGYLGTRRGEPVFTAEVVYVSVRLGETQAIETPAAIRAALGDAVDLFRAGNDAARAGQGGGGEKRPAGSG